MLFCRLWPLLERSRGHGGQYEYIYYIWAPIIYTYQRYYSLFAYFSTQMWDSVAIWRRSMLKQLEKFIPINNYKRINTPTLGIEYTYLFFWHVITIEKLNSECLSWRHDKWWNYNTLLSKHTGFFSIRSNTIQYSNYICQNNGLFSQIPQEF